MFVQDLTLDVPSVARTLRGTLDVTFKSDIDNRAESILALTLPPLRREVSRRRFTTNVDLSKAFDSCGYRLLDFFRLTRTSAAYGETPSRRSG